MFNAENCLLAANGAVEDGDREWAYDALNEFFTRRANGEIRDVNLDSQFDTVVLKYRVVFDEDPGFGP